MLVLLQLLLQLQLLPLPRCQLTRRILSIRSEQRHVNAAGITTVSTQTVNLVRGIVPCQPSRLHCRCHA